MARKKKMKVSQRTIRDFRNNLFGRTGNNLGAAVFDDDEYEEDGPNDTFD